MCERVCVCVRNATNKRRWSVSCWTYLTIEYSGLHTCNDIVCMCVVFINSRSSSCPVDLECKTQVECPPPTEKPDRNTRPACERVLPFILLATKPHVMVVRPPTWHGFSLATGARHHRDDAANGSISGRPFHGNLFNLCTVLPPLESRRRLLHPLLMKKMRTHTDTRTRDACRSRAWP